jgi:transposase
MRCRHQVWFDLEEWEEYRAVHEDGYGYSRFCHHYQHWKRQRDLVIDSMLL